MNTAENVDADLDRLLSDSTLVLVVGTGGVGKTTTAAALAVRAADRLGRRVLVLTVDPARRLADALGVDGLVDTPVLVPLGGGGDGRLWARMVDMSTSWDRLVEACAPKPSVADELLANRLYRSLTTNFIQSHDYIALDQLNDLADGRYDLVIIDTPPSAHVLDLIDAPERMVEFLDSTLLNVLTGGPVGRGVGQLAVKPFLQLARRLLGSDFLSEISRFFLLLRKLGPRFRTRSEAVRRRLDEPTTRWIGVTSPAGSSGREFATLTEGLSDRRIDLDLLIVNRSLRAAVTPSSASASSPSPPSPVVDDEELAAAMEQWRSVAEAEPSMVEGPPQLRIPYRPEGIEGLDGLTGFFSPS